MQTRQQLMAIAQTLEEATPALDFEIPLPSGDPRWVDFTPARGGSAIRNIRKLFERQPAGRPLHVVFASHRGAGKTTELKRLASELASGYFAVYFEANVEMDANRFEMEDLLLVVARTVEEEMRNHGLPLRSDLLGDIEKWFSTVVLTTEQGKSFLSGIKAEAGTEAGIPFFAKFMASLTSSMQIESSHRAAIKSTLKQFPGALTEYVNKLLDAANSSLAPQGRQLLLLIDNMDRYEPKVIDELLVQSADRFKALRCHLVVTPPIGLVLRPQSQTIESVFRCETMPTVCLRAKNQPYTDCSGSGYELMVEALRRRVDVDALIPGIDTRHRLVLASGGAIRELLELSQDATLEANAATISLSDVEAVVHRRRQRFRDRIDANGWWDVLRDIGREKRLGEDKKYLDVLFQRLAFQYNGENWYDVHPLVSELPDFAPGPNAAPAKAKRAPGRGKSR